MAVHEWQTRAPVARSSGEWRDHLESALAELGNASRLLQNGAQPVADLRRAADEIVSAYRYVFEAYDSVSEPAQTLARAEANLALAGQVLRVGSESSAAIAFAIECCELARRELAMAQDLVLGRSWRPQPAAPPLRASSRGLRLHFLNRPRLVPTLRVPEVRPEVHPQLAPPFAPPTTFEELEAAVAGLRQRAAERRKDAAERAQANPAELVTPERKAVPPGFSPDHLPALSEHEFTRQRARECFEEVVMAGMQRQPLEGDDWRALASVEQRLLANVDALVALGPAALAQVEPLIMDFPIRDPARVWAVTVLFGALSGRDALAVAERVFVDSLVAAPESAAAFASALRLVPHPSLEVTLRRLLAEPMNACRAVAIAVLAARGWAKVDDLERAAHDEPEVAVCALPYYALTGHAGVRGALDGALANDVAKQGDALWWAMAYAGHPGLAATLRAELLGERARPAALIFALTCSQAELRELEQLALETEHGAFIDALGWAGSPSSVPHLLRALEHEEPPIVRAAADALSRITGHRPLEEVLVPPEALDLAEPPAPAEPDETAEPPLATVVSDPRDLPEDGSPDVVLRVSTAPAIWQAYWAEHRARFTPDRRYRRGVPHSAAAVWSELNHGPCTFAERAVLARELILASGGYVPFDVSDFVWQQEAALGAWQPVAEAASARQGSFGVPSRRSGYVERR